MSDMLNIHIMYGLPGSGKTHYCNQVRKKWLKSMNNRYLNMDQVAIIEGGKTSVLNRRKVFDAIKHDVAYTYGDTLIIDGLLVTKTKLFEIMEACFYATKRDIKFHIHAWNENRENCEINDIGRVKQKEGRYIRSTISIRNLPYEELTKKDLEEAIDMLFDIKDKNRITLQRHSVIVKPDYVRFYEERNICLEETEQSKLDDIDRSKYLVSDWWCLGGSINSYTGNSCYVDADEQPEFEVLFEVLDTVDENLTFKKGRRIMKELVQKEYKTESDFYGGEIKYCRYKISYEEMYEMLEDNETE